MEMETKRTRGRPPRNEIDRISGRMWFTAVSLASGLPAGKLEHHIRDDLLERYEDELAQTNAWYGYQRGDRSPSDKLVAMVESQYPGTAIWCRNLLWTALKMGDIHSSRANKLAAKLSSETWTSLRIAFPTHGDYTFFNEHGLIQLSRRASAEVFGVLFLMQRTYDKTRYRNEELIAACRRWLFIHSQKAGIVQKHWDELIQLCATYAPELGDLKKGLAGFKMWKNSEGPLEIFSRGFAPGLYLDDDDPTQ